jgi:diaminohydroxyphosphoribosylaminopyrimidine deaminase / 5-amino-6-(5-phosphoribosylamino)uracil reductase
MARSKPPQAGIGPGAQATHRPGGPGADLHWLAAAVDLSRRCPRSESAFSVGAILVGASGEVLATGYSRESGAADHAEEVALRRAEGAGLAEATLYSTLEPCLRRKSRPLSCSALIAEAGLRRVVIAWREPPVFVQGGGATWMAARGVTVVELPELASAARAVNAHLLSP